MPKIQLTDLSAPVLIALVRRALADRIHADPAVRREAVAFIDRLCGVKE